jgi:hypothetical protein
MNHLLVVGCGLLGPISRVVPKDKRSTLADSLARNKAFVHVRAFGVLPEGSVFLVLSFQTRTSAVTSASNLQDLPQATRPGGFAPDPI